MMDTWDSQHGFWGERTASVDWCEENYALSRYIAEFWNTLSNLAIILPGLVGLVQAVRDKAETRFVVAYLLLVVVGCGSWAFHMTLLHCMQVCDEIPMLWGVAVATYCLWENRASPESFNKRLLASQFLVTTVVTGVCATTRDSRIFPVCFGAFVLVLTIQSVIVIRTQKCNSRLMKMATLIYAVGSVLWVVDRSKCQLVRNIRCLFPEAVQPLLQLHGWWHVFAGCASTLVILFMYDLRCRELKHPYTMQKCFFIPYMKVKTTFKKEV